MTKTLKISKPQTFKDANKACTEIDKIYTEQVTFLCDQFDSFSTGKVPKEKVRGFYPYLKIEVTESSYKKLGSKQKHSYGFVSSPGMYETTLTRPDIFARYYHEQITHLLNNHDCEVEIGVSDTPIPIHFALGEEFHLEADLTDEHLDKMPNLFDLPDLENMDDQIANSKYIVKAGQAEPLALFTAPRTDLSLMRLKHYTGTNAAHFQNFVIFTNYQFYIDEFTKIGTDSVGKDGYTEFVEPDSDARIPQMPAYHLKRKNGMGITMINIGVGPSNAKNITDTGI